MTPSCSRHCGKRNRNLGTADTPWQCLQRVVARVCRAVVLWRFQNAVCFTHYYLFMMSLAIKRASAINFFVSISLPCALGSNLMWSPHHLSVWNFTVRSDWKDDIRWCCTNAEKAIAETPNNLVPVLQLTLLLLGKPRGLHSYVFEDLQF